jgi:plastocyanin
MRFLMLAAAIGLAAPVSASAADVEVSVGDNFFRARTVQIQPGDTVTWRWIGADSHNVRTFPNQTMRFRSRLLTSGIFRQTFRERGRFTYFCEVHGPTMSGAVEVGPPPFPDTLLPRLTRLAARGGEGTVRLSFRLSERSRVRVSLRGPARRTRTSRLGRGARSVSLRGLPAGRYRATLRPTDGAGNRGKAATKRFSVR